MCASSLSGITQVFPLTRSDLWSIDVCPFLALFLSLPLYLNHSFIASLLLVSPVRADLCAARKRLIPAWRGGVTRRFTTIQLHTTPLSYTKHTHSAVFPSELCPVYFDINSTRQKRRLDQDFGCNHAVAYTALLFINGAHLLIVLRRFCVSTAPLADKSGIVFVWVREIHKKIIPNLIYK